MKFLKQFTVIIVISFLGELLYHLLPLPVPASVYGLVLMLAALKTGILKVGQVKEAAQFLIEIMPVMFIPAGVGLMTSWDVLKPIWMPIILITIITTVVVMAVTGIVTQTVIQNGKKKEKKVQGADK